MAPTLLYVPGMKDTKKRTAKAAPRHTYSVTIEAKVIVRATSREEAMLLASVMAGSHNINCVRVVNVQGVGEAE